MRSPESSPAAIGISSSWTANGRVGPFLCPLRRIVRRREPRQLGRLITSSNRPITGNPSSSARTCRTSPSWPIPSSEREGRGVVRTDEDLEGMFLLGDEARAPRDGAAGHNSPRSAGRRTGRSWRSSGLWKRGSQMRDNRTGRKIAALFLAGLLSTCAIGFPCRSRGRMMKPSGNSKISLAKAGKDVKDVLVSPLYWQKNDFLKLSAVLGTGLLLGLADENLRTWVQEAAYLRIGRLFRLCHEFRRRRLPMRFHARPFCGG